jgi:ATP diphosphatase
MRRWHRKRTFNFDDICAAISSKLERRHPHIFGDATAATAPKCCWEQIKSAERAEKSQHLRWTTSR